MSRPSPCTHSIIHKYVTDRRPTCLILRHRQQAYFSAHLHINHKSWLHSPLSPFIFILLSKHTFFNSSFTLSAPLPLYLSLPSSLHLLLSWSTCWGIWPLSGRPVGSRSPWDRYIGTRPAGWPWSGSGSDRSEPQGSQSHGTSYTPPVGGKREHTHWTTLSNISSVYYWHSGVSGTCSM